VVTVIAAWLAWLVVAGGLFLKQDQLLSKPR